MKKFLLKLIIFLVLLYASDYLLGMGIKELFFNYSTRGNRKVIYTIEEANADVYFFGSSRAHHNFVPSVFSDSLNLKCANVGRDGQGIYYHSAILNVLLKRSKPQIVILELVSSDYTKTDNKIDKDRLSILLPFFDKHPELEEIIMKRGTSEKFKLFSKLYPYNSLIFNIVKSLLDKNIKETFEGYEPLYGTYTQGIKKIDDNEGINNDLEKLFVLKEFFKRLRDINCYIYVIRAPTYAIIDRIPTNEALEKIFAEYDINYYDYRKDTTFLKHPDWFKDIGHLNHMGAIYFSKEIAYQIKQRR